MLRHTVRLAALFLSMVVLASPAASGQDNIAGSARGRAVADATGKGLEFVNVTVLTRDDSTTAGGAVTAKDGSFNVQGLRAGNYVCRLSMLGYATAFTKPFRIDATRRDAELGTVRLAEAAVNLDEVVVTREKLALNNEIDRKVYNVGQDVAAAAGSASDVLQNIPSVEVDIEGNVSLRGSESVLILINGKNSPLMGASRATVLQQLPASALERVEVITNPSAKYKPDGTSGIINLVLKKNTDLGFNGSATANAGNKDRYNGNLRLNYKPDGINVFGSYAIRRDSRNRIGSDERVQPAGAAEAGFYREDLTSTARPLSHTATLGAEAEFSEEYSAGVSGELFRYDFTRRDRSVKQWRDPAGTTTANATRDRIDDEFENEYGYTAFTERSFGEEHTLRAELSGSGETEQEDNRYTNFFNFPAAPSTRDNTLVKDAQRSTRATLEYTLPVNERARFEAGYAGDFTANSTEFRAETHDSVSDIFILDTARSNQFEFSEALHAAYVTYQSAFGAFGVQTGLRAEQAFTTSKLVTLASTARNDYFSLYPTVHLSYALGEMSELQLNYSRRTNRPDGGDLNPFPEYTDPKNVSAGNPKLLPEYVHSIETGVKYEGGFFSLIPSLYYRYTYNRFTSVTRILADSTFLTTEENLDHDQAAGLEIILSASAQNLFSANLSGNLFYSRIDASNLGYGTDKSTMIWRGALTLTLNLTEGTMLQVNAHYNSGRLTPQGRMNPSGVLNLGLRQRFFDGRLLAVLTAADVLQTMRRETVIDTPELYRVQQFKRDSRIVYLGLTWNFGAPPKKEEGLKYDESM